MSNKIDVGALADTIAKHLSSYTREIAEEVKGAADETAKELLTNTKSDAPRRTGKYAKAMKIKTMHESEYEKRVRWYVDQKSGLYRLSHLLEKGHALRNGGRTKSYPHIQKNEEIAKQAFSERVERAIKNGK